MGWSLFVPVKRRGLAKRDESSILRRWARLYPIGFGEAEGAGFADTDGEKSDGELVSSLKEKRGLGEARPIVDPSTMGSSLSDKVG